MPTRNALQWHDKARQTLWPRFAACGTAGTPLLYPSGNLLGGKTILGLKTEQLPVEMQSD